MNIHDALKLAAEIEGGAPFDEGEIVETLRQQPEPVAQKCGMRYAPVWKREGEHTYQESSFSCGACDYLGKHDTHPGCMRRHAGGRAMLA